jgi:hypothetical protein
MCKEMMVVTRLKMNQQSILRSRQSRNEKDKVRFEIAEYGPRISMELDFKDQNRCKSGQLIRAAPLCNIHDAWNYDTGSVPGSG